MSCNAVVSAEPFQYIHKGLLALVYMISEASPSHGLQPRGYPKPVQFGKETDELGLRLD